jgi:CheY-like chemotaxis protein
MEETGGILEINVETQYLTKDTVGSYPDLTPGNYIKITVSDTGRGIDSEIIDRVFDPYFTTKETGKGSSGMGLAVVHGIVKNHDGTITVDSQPGEGTVFTILFPVVKEKPVMEAGTPDEIPHGNETILFIDDEELIVNMTKKMLEHLGYTVETKISPVGALALFQSNPDHFDLVITDMTMPEMTGAKLSVKLKDIRPDIPIIICTGHSSLIDEKRAKAMGIAEYIIKPIANKDIAKTIRKLLDNKKIVSLG